MTVILDALAGARTQIIGDPRHVLTERTAEFQAVTAERDEALAHQTATVEVPGVAAAPASELRGSADMTSSPPTRMGAGRHRSDDRLGIVDTPEATVNQLPSPRCHLPWQEMVIQADGTVEPCCYWTAHGNANPPLGNINASSIDEIWNGERYQRLRTNMASGNLVAAGCANCFAIKQGQTLGLEYDEDCDKPEFRNAPYAENIRVLKHEISEHAAELKAKPTILSVTVSHKCNLACLHCYQNSTRDRQWQREDALTEISALIPTLVRLIAGGGEPLLLSHWRKFLAKFDPARAPLLNFAMTTNATILKPDVLDGLTRFKSLHVIVSLDGANSQVYDRIRVNGSFEAVAKNIHILRDVVAARPSTAVTTFGLCMSVMKSNITHLPEYVRWAAEQGLLFSIHPVLSLPFSESLAAFNDPELEMSGWREALDEARRVLRTIEAPALPPLWRTIQTLRGRASRQAWPFLQPLEDFIPWDLHFSKHYRVRLRIPSEQLQEAEQLRPRERTVLVVWPAVEQSEIRKPVTYYSLIRDGCCEISLPVGEHPCCLMPEGGPLSVGLGVCQVRPTGTAVICEPSRYGDYLRSALSLPETLLTPSNDRVASERSLVFSHGSD